MDMNQQAYEFAKATLEWHSKGNFHAGLLGQAEESVRQANAWMASSQELLDGPGETELERLRRENAKLRALVAERGI